MNLTTKVLKEDHTLNEELFELLSFDDDHNGKNGEEYLIDSALKNDYENNLSYWIAEGLNQGYGIKGTIEHVLSESNASSYFGVAYNIQKIDTERYIVSLAWCSKDD